MKTFKIIHEYKILDSESYKSFENIMYAVVAWFQMRRFDLDIYRYFKRVEFSKNL